MMETKDSTVQDGIGAARLALKDCGVRLVNGVPGYPINHLFTALQNDKNMDARWQYNEKIAFEMAMGASVLGERAAVVCKHVGVNILSDPLIISSTHGIGAGIVVIAGDDVGAAFSNDEQDSRWYGKLAEIPVFDPATPQDIYESITYGIGLSERISAPVLVRVTENALNEKGAVSGKKIPNEHKQLDRSFWLNTMLGSHQRYLLDGWSLALNDANHSPLNSSIKRGKKGIISSGHTSIAASQVADSLGMSHLSLCFLNPFPSDLVDDFIMGLDSVIVCEEIAPFIEERMGLGRVRGRLTGHLPRAGPLDETSIREGMEQIDAPLVQRTIKPQTMKDRGYSVGHCAECSYHSVYSAIKSLGVPVAGDAGCSIISANPPYSMLNVMCGLGSSVSSACGFPRKGIAMMGDFALLHTGLQALVNAKLNDYDLLVVIFANGEAAMTGGQQLPDVTGLLKDIFKDDCVLSDASRLSEEQVKTDLEKLFKAPGLKIYVVTSSCPVNHKFPTNPLG
jgi:indolepyruvate ferredoxin oxidoreductase alpha subunit